MRSIFAILFLYFVLESNAQFNVKFYNVEDGLQSNIVTNLGKDQNGYLWFINANQLCRFDGSKFEYVNDPKAKLGISFQFPSFLTIYKNKITVIRENRPYFYDKGEFHPYNIPDSLTGYYKIDKYGHILLDGKSSVIDRNSPEINYNKLYNYDSHIKYPDYYFNHHKFQINENFELCYYSGDTIRTIDKDGKLVDIISPFKLKKYPVVLRHENYLFQYIYQEEKLAWSNGKDTFSHMLPRPNVVSTNTSDGPTIKSTPTGFAFFFAGLFVSEKGVFYDRSLKDIPIKYILSSSEVLLYDNNQGLFYKNFITGELNVIDGIPTGLSNENRLSDLQFTQLDNDQVAIGSSKGLFVLATNKSFYSLRLNPKLNRFLPNYKINTFSPIDKSNFIVKIHHDSTFKDIKEDKDGFGYFQPHKIALVNDTSAILLEEYSEYSVVRDTDGKNKSTILSGKNKFRVILEHGVYDISTPDNWKKGNSYQVEPILLKDKNFFFFGKNGSILKANQKESHVFENPMLKNRVFRGAYLNQYAIFINNQLIIDSLYIYDIKSNETSTIPLSDSISFFQTFLSSGESLWLFNMKGTLIQINLKNNNIKKFDIKLVSERNSYYNLFIDSKNNLWFTSVKGIEVLNLNKPTSVKSINSQLFFPGEINNFSEDKHGNIIVFGSKCIGWANIDSLIKNNSPFKLIITESSLGTTVNFKSKNFVNDFILYGDNDFYVKIPSNFSTSSIKYIPKILLKKFSTNKKTYYGNYVDLLNPILEEFPNEFSYDENNLLFNFTALEFRDHERLKYRYKLSGIFEDWKYTDNPTIELIDLKSGQYTFEIQSIYDGVPSQSFVYKFNISPPWWKSTIAYLIYIVFVLVILYLVLRLRTRQLRNKKIELENKVSQATSEITKQKNEIEKAHIETQKQKEIIEEAHKEITDSINYAERIQRSFLASDKLLQNYLQNYFIYFNPKEAVSGDFYWAGVLSNGHFAISCADSTGHGVPGAIMSILNISSIEKAVEKAIYEPSEIFNETRKLIIERLKKDGSTEGGKDGMDAVLVSFNSEKTMMKYVAAQNPIWIIRNGELVEIKAEKMPVGKHDMDTTPFIGGQIELQKNDIVYAMTDGFQDQFGGEKGKKFKVANFKKLLLSIQNESMSNQLILIREAFESWKGKIEQVDDVCLIGIKI